MSKPMMDLCRPLQVPPSAKSVLMVLAYMHHDEADLYPSLTYLEESTCLSRGSVVDAVKTLEACGLVQCNRTNRVRTLYRINPAGLDAAKIPVSRRTASRQASATARPVASSNAQLEEAAESAPAATQDSADARPPLVQLPDQQDGAAGANAQGQVVQMPSEVVHLPISLVGQLDPISKKQLEQEELIEKKAETEIFQLDGSGQQEAGTTEKKSRGKKPATPGFDPATVDLPEGLDRPLWLRWLADLKARKQAPTEEAVRLQLKRMAGYITQGLAPLDVIEHSIASRYRSPFPPPAQKFPARRAGAPHGGFSSIDYEKDTTDGRPPA